MKKIYKPKHKPQIGDMRERRVFLLFPKTQCGKDNRKSCWGKDIHITRWLEYATIKEQLCELIGLDWQVIGKEWEFICFLD